MNSTRVFASFVCLLGLAPLRAANLVEITPVTDRIIALRFDDGTVTRRTAGQPLSADRVQVAPLAVAALSTGAFSVASAHDPAYAVPRAPVALHRKTKGTEFAAREENWLWEGPRGTGFYPASPYHADEHWIYLELPSALVAGAVYSFSWDAAALNTGAAAGATLAFEPARVRSEAVHVNTLGYLPDAPAKIAYLYHWAGARGGIDYAAWQGRPFRVVRTADGATALAGVVAARKPAGNVESAWGTDFLGTGVWECDFSALAEAGQYRVVVDGIGCSYDFVVAPDVYLKPFRAAMRGIYQQRSGIALTTPFADEARPAPHNPGLTPGFAGRLRYTTHRLCDMENGDAGSAADKALIEAGARGALTGTWGWYQDAGDWDGYLTHTEVPLNLLLLYRGAPRTFYDGQLALPEHANGVPDVLDEAAWLPRYFHRLRHELLAKGWGTGGVGGRVFGDQWGPDQPDANFARGSWHDVDRDWYVTGEDPFSTYRYAACAALLAESLGGLGLPDPEGVDWAVEAAEAYAWALANTRDGDEGRAGANGSLRDDRALAAVALYRLTGGAEYHARFLADTAGRAGAELTGSALQAATLYLTLPAGRAPDAARVAELRGALYSPTLWVQTLSVGNRAMRWAGNWWQPAEVGAATTPLIAPIVYARQVLAAGDPVFAAELRGHTLTTADYSLGGNPLHTTWISNLGPRPPTGTFHFDDWALGPKPRTGLIPYGPTRYGVLWFWWPLRIPASPVWAYDTAFPEIDSDPLLFEPTGPGTWPVHESWFDQATAPQTCEFTIHQTQINAALAYGSLLPEREATGWAAWQARHFSTGELTSGAAAPGAAPDGDGVPNFLKYALAAPDPRRAWTAPRPDLSPGGAFALRFTRARLATEATYTVESSADLVTWTVLATNPGLPGDDITVTESVSENPRRFLRLRVTQP
jgi:endoglucanase